MAKTPGATCLIDVRTSAISQDYVISTNPCAPGAALALARRNRFGLKTLLENCEPPACGYDRVKDLASAGGALVIVGTCIGIVHTLPIFIPYASIEYEAGYLELCLVLSATHLVFQLATCAASPVIEYAGHRLTALFGMIFMFVGLVLDSQAFHIAVMYMGNILFVGVGAGLAYAASMCLPSDLFRSKLAIGTTIVSIGGSIGTIFYTWFSIQILDVLGYKWTKLMLSVLVLFFTLTVHVFPKTRLMYATGCDASQSGDKATTIRDCVYQTALENNNNKKSDECEPEEGKSCMCVCVCDLRLFIDKSFLLWATLVMVATINFQIPYLSMVTYAESVGAKISPWYTTVYCLTSLAARVAIIFNPDFTFLFNRNIFMGCTAFSGLMWILLAFASTFGWILVCCVLLGAVEGILCVVIGRVAIGTIPRKWIGGSWVSCILFHAFGIFVMAVFTSVISLETLQFFVAFITSGIMQIIVSFLALLLPNEEDEGPVAPATGTTKVGFSSAAGLCGPGISTIGSLNCSSLGMSYYGCVGLSSYGSGGFGLTRSSAYRCQCHICSRLGCIPECSPKVCVPEGSLDKRGCPPPSQGSSSTKDEEC